MQRDRTPCKATRANGERCKSPAVRSSGYCWAHEPGGAEARQEARRAGGKAKSRAARLDRLVPATLRPVLVTLLDALDGVHSAEGDDSVPRVTPAQAQAMASLAGAIVKVYQVGVLEERVEALEEEQKREQEASARWPTYNS